MTSAPGPSPGSHQLQQEPPSQLTSAAIRFPFSFRLPFQTHASPTSLAESTAEGRSIKVDDSTAENRTSALRQLNHNYPSKYRYAKSTGAQNSTYSEPVIVRSYYQAPLPPSRTTSITRNGILVHAVATMSSKPGSTASRTKVPQARKSVPDSTGILGFMAKVRGRPSDQSTSSHAEEVKLPPVEAFSFKSFLDKLEEDGAANDINADLDRIAEICARSRYSLSNQYEVHHAPHGSGTEFLATARQRQAHGPTLQVITSEDESPMKRSRRTRAKRNSQAVGTLETIMSTSRSSEEDKSAKRSAAELAEEVRGRAARTLPEATPNLQSVPDASHEQVSADEQDPTRPAHKRTISSLALMDGSQQAAQPNSSSATRKSVAPVGEPAMPQPSTSVLEITTSPSKRPSKRQAPITGLPRSDIFGDMMATSSQPTDAVNGANATGLLSSLTGWVPWTGAEQGTLGNAEHSLRDLLKTSDSKNKLGEGGEQAF